MVQFDYIWSCVKGGRGLRALSGTIAAVSNRKSCGGHHI